MKILILGGGWQQLPAILQAKRMGLQVIVADYLENVPGRREVDVFYPVSTTEREKVLELAKVEQIDGVLAYASDPAAATAAYVAEKLHLPGNPLRAAEILGNKARFREFLRKIEIPAPQTVILKAEDCADPENRVDAGITGIRDDAEELSFHYPLFIKPLDSSGSKGITLLRKRDPARLFEAYRTALSYSRSGQVLAEEYIPYEYPHLIGGDVVIRDGRIVCLGLMDCIREGQDGLVPCGKIWPSRAPQEIRTKIAENLERVTEKLKIADAELNVEFIAGSDEIVYPVEIALRCGGNGIPQLLSDTTGQDWIGEEIRRAIRPEKVPIPILKEKCRIQDVEKGTWKRTLDSAGKQQNTCSRTANNEKGTVNYATWNLHTNRSGLFAGYEIRGPLAQLCYRTEIFYRKGDEVTSFHHAGGILGILYFRFTEQKEAEEMIRRFPTDILVHVISIDNMNDVSMAARHADDYKCIYKEEMRSNTSDFTVAREAVQRKALRQEILRLGEYMNPSFSARERCGWDPAAYAGKLTENAEILAARDETGRIIGLIAAYLNRKEEAFISMLVVEPEYRRCHVAEALCLRIHELARERGIPRVRGEIREDNTACRRLAGKLGYRRVKESGRWGILLAEISKTRR